MKGSAEYVVEVFNRIGVSVGSLLTVGNTELYIME